MYIYYGAAHGLLHEVVRGLGAQREHGRREVPRDVSYLSLIIIAIKNNSY